MEYRILGPIEARFDGRSLPLGGPKQRALLAMLLLHANEPVSRDRLIDGIWGDRPPPSAAHSLDGYVSRLRRALGSDRVVRRAPGYLLSVEPNELDLDRFERLVDQAHEASAAGNISAAAECLEDALRLWRGPALADILFEPFASVEAERLEERRLVACEESIDAQLALGEGAGLASRLQGLVRDHPFRERLLGQLMTALYRGGRQAEALAVLQAARLRFTADLGLEPGVQLRELERRILQHDPSLDAPRRSARSSGRQRPRALVVLGALVMATAAAAILLTTRGAARLSPLGGTTSRLVVLDSASGAVSDAAELPGLPAAVALGNGSLWVADPSNEVVERVDPSSRAVVDRIPIAGEPGRIVSGGGAIWVASTLGGAIHRIDPATDAVTQTVPLAGANASDIVVGAGRLWVADMTDKALVEIDPSGGSVIRTLALDLRPTALAAGKREIWVAGYDEGSVEEIDLRSGERIATVNVGNGPAALAAGEDAVWVANNLDASVSRIDPRTASVVATIPVGSGPAALALASGSVWVANTFSGDVSKIDPRKNTVVAKTRVGGKPASLAALQERVWVGAGPVGDVHRGGTLTLVSSAPFPTIDPASDDFAGSLQFGALVHDSLVTFERAAGPDGLRLVPDLALALPRPTDNGTTYAFRLRPGIRYSDGRRLQANDFRRALERLFSVGSRGADLFAGIDGAPACMRHPARCDLSSGVVTDDVARTVVFHLRVPDSDFLYKLTVSAFSAPVPPGTPDYDAGLRAVPGTGPYRVVAADHHQVRLVRNRFFREWSHAAQPNGNPDRVTWRFTRSPGAAIRAVEQGKADWLSDLIPPGQLKAFHLRYPARLHSNPSFVVDSIPLNTSRPPFDDVRVRQALNLAIDRAKIVQMYGGSSAATPICQPLAAGMPGYSRYCPYTRNPRRKGLWTAPDLQRARRLVASSGTRGARVEIWGATGLHIPRQLPSYIAQVLRSLGYRTRLHIIPYASYSATLRRKIQLTVDGDWQPDYPAPSSYLPSFFGCDGGHNKKHYVCDPELDQAMRRAAGAELADPARAGALWARVDHEIVDQAFWVPTVNVRNTEFVSRRLRNYQFNPVGGFIADQVWLH